MAYIRVAVEGFLPEIDSGLRLLSALPISRLEFRITGPFLMQAFSMEMTGREKRRARFDWLTS